MSQQNPIEIPCWVINVNNTEPLGDRMVWRLEGASVPAVMIIAIFCRVMVLLSTANDNPNGYG